MLQKKTFFPEPETTTDNCLNGIIRNSRVITKTESSLYKYPNNDFALIGNSYNNWWSSEEDSSFKQYVQIIFLDRVVKVDTYHFYTPNNTGGGYSYFSKTWTLSCSLYGDIWHILDTHDNDPSINDIKQKHIFHTDKIQKCRIFSFNITGPDNHGRNYGYFGPVEFYGWSYDTIKTINANKTQFSPIFLFIYLFI